MRRRFRSLASTSAGFSLLELLVVVMIIAIFAGAAMLSVGSVGSDRELRREAERLQTVIDLLNEEAVLETRDYGLLFTASGYRFYIYDHQTAAWLAPADDALLAARELEAPIELSLELEDRDVELARGFETLSRLEQPEPQVVVFASGEVTPFTASFYREFAGGRFVVGVEFDGTATVSEDGFDSR